MLRLFSLQQTTRSNFRNTYFTLRLDQNNCQPVRFFFRHYYTPLSHIFLLGCPENIK